MRQRSDSRVLFASKNNDGERHDESAYTVDSFLDSGLAKTGIAAMINYQGRLFFFFILTWIAFILYIIHPHFSTKSTAPFDVDRSANNVEVYNITKPPANLHLLIPASSPDANLCKVMVSAGILGYPDPVIINWNETFEEKGMVAGGSHLAKIKGINDYLQQLSYIEDDDLVLMVDGYDVWLQLRPQTLIDRFFDMNARADKRIASELGVAAEKHDIRQEIIFGTQKRCWPWKKTDTPCYAAPFSTLPADIYGPDTDTDVDFKPNPYIKYRPRYLNSGVMLGTVKASRKMFERALALMSHESNFGSDQFIFSHIFGDQEIWREALRREERTPEMIEKESLPTYQPLHPFKDKHIEKAHEKAAAWTTGSLEFGIGLDYEMSIGLNTVFNEDDTEWLHWQEEESLRQAEARVGVAESHSHMHQLSRDIVDTLPPFWTFNHEPKLPRSSNWSDVNLFTNVWTGIVPAVIHHNAHRDHRKTLRVTWWDQIWFANYTRLMYDAHVYEPIVPVAISGYDRENLREFWPAERWKGGGRNGPKLDSVDESDRWVRFDDICRDFHEEVFRDGKGPWILPAVH